MASGRTRWRRTVGSKGKRASLGLERLEDAGGRHGELQNCHSCPILVMGSYNLYEWYASMTRLNVSKAREEFPEVVNRAAYGKERTIVSRRGKDLAAVIPMDDLHLLERLAREEMDRIDLEDARAALKEAEEKGTISLRDLMRELGE